MQDVENHTLFETLEKCKPSRGVRQSSPIGQTTTDLYQVNSEVLRAISDLSQYNRRGEIQTQSLNESPNESETDGFGVGGFKSSPSNRQASANVGCRRVLMNDPLLQTVIAPSHQQNNKL